MPADPSVGVGDDPLPGHHTSPGDLGDMDAVFARAGAMSPVLRSADWASTSLGVPSDWPQSLRFAASVCLGAKYPMAIYWGPDLSLIYNEAWSVIPGDWHPWALGRRARDVWPEIWGIVGPDFERAMAGEGRWNSDRLLPMRRHGYLEETYFDYNLSPILGEAGDVDGVLNAGIETTWRVLTERRNQLLFDLTAATTATAGVAETAVALAEALAQDASTVPFAALYLFDEAGYAHLASTVRIEAGQDHSPEIVRLGSGRSTDPWRLGELRRCRTPIVHDGINHLYGILPSGDWPEPPSTAVTLPIVPGGAASTRRVIGGLVLGVPAGRRIDDAMTQFFGLLADQLASILVNARNDEQERRAFEIEHRIATTLQQSLLPNLPTVDGVTLTGRYLPGSADVDVGGDWYDAVHLPSGEVAVIIGDVMGKGVGAAAQMGQLRNALRAYLLEGFSPAEVLDKLNHLTISLSGPSFATVLCLFFDPATRAVRWCRAGHLPALVRSVDGSTRFLEGRPSPPLAVFPDGRFIDQTGRLDPGDAVVLFTDGLVERRDEHLDVGLERLARAVSACDRVETLVDVVVAPLVGVERRDDVAVVVLGT